MIGRLSGTLLSKHPPWLLIDVGGVGYEVEAPMSVFYELPAIGAPVTLITHLLVREDARLLYGFLHARERALFRDLLRVTGVGAKMALAILSGMEARQFARCIERNDTAALRRLPGVGEKTAQRLVMEMKDRLGSLVDDPPPGAAFVSPASGGGAPDPLDDAISALIALGYKPADAQRMARAVGGETASSEAIIRAALKALHRA